MENRKSLKEVLMQRDGLSSKQADDLISEAQDAFYARMEEGEFFDLEVDICEEFFNLEPDYIEDMLY